MGKKIFFHIKNGARERQLDTAINAKKVVESIHPDMSTLNSSAKNYSVYSSYKGWLKNKALSSLPLLNVGFLPPEHRLASGSYLWGYLPLNPSNPYTIEMDNPYCLSYYNYSAFRAYKEVSALFLEKANRLNFISNAARSNFLEEFGGRFEDKSSVLYPFVKRRFKEGKKDGKTVNFLFVGLSFRNKGGLELLEAFCAVKNENIRLHFVSYTPEPVRQKYANDSRIIFYAPMSREKLLNEIYPNMDVFVLPSLYESFGMAFLEALSFGMGVIGVNVYATPEMIEDRANGRLLEHPILKSEIYFGQEIVSPLKIHLMEFNERYLKDGVVYSSLVLSLVEAINEACDNYENWRRQSISIYEEKFSEEIWLKRFEGFV